MNTNEMLEARKLLAEIEVSMRKLNDLFGGSAHMPQPKSPGFQQALSEHGESGCIDELLGSGTLDQKTIDFLQSLSKGIEKYKGLTVKQNEVLGKIWDRSHSDEPKF